LTGWNDSFNGEIDDICPWQTGPVNGFTVQKEWSNSPSACAVAPSAASSGNGSLDPAVRE
jgi:hypothetical protein